MKLKFIALAAALCFGLTGTQAQKYDYDPFPYGFVGVQGGAQMLLLNYDHTKLITPMAGVQLGGMFSPYLGARLSAQGMWTKHGFKALDATFNHKYVMGTIDMLVNVSNFFTKNKAHRFNTYLIGGLGLNYSWGEDDAATNALSIHTGENVTHVLRVGLAEEVNLCRNLALNLEVDLNNIHDRYLSYRDKNDVWQLTAALGLSYKFGYKKHARPAPVAEAPVVAPQPAPKPAPQPTAAAAKKVEPQPKPQPKPVVKPFVPERDEIDVFFGLGKSNITPEAEAKIKALGEWLKTRPNTKVVVTGYADAGTGSAKRNMVVSQNRAENVAKELIDVYGFDANQVTVDYKGDTVQPYQENDLNRLVRIQAETFEKK